MILEKRKEKNKYVYYVNGKRVKWIVITNINNEAVGKDSFLTSSSSGPIILKYQIEGLSGTFERQFSAANLIVEDKTKISWNLLDELPSADWAWDKMIDRGTLI